MVLFTNNQDESNALAPTSEEGTLIYQINTGTTWIVRRGRLLAVAVPNDILDNTARLDALERSSSSHNELVIPVLHGNATEASVTTSLITPNIVVRNGLRTDITATFTDVNGINVYNIESGATHTYTPAIGTYVRMDFVPTTQTNQHGEIIVDLTP